MELQQAYQLIPFEKIPEEQDWLLRQVNPVLAYGDGKTLNADVVLKTKADARGLISTIEKTPVAAMALVQVLRSAEFLPIESALTVESLSYATLQSGAEFAAWLNVQSTPPQLISNEEDAAITIGRKGNIVSAQLNRPADRNSISVEMRDALVELLDLVILDDNISQLHLSGNGACFSAGGELREFGLQSDPAMAHAIRSKHSPSRLIARCADRVTCHLHSACIGSGIEIAAFAKKVIAHPRTFFQLPELQFGLIPGAGGCVSIPRRIGRQRTAWLALSGKKINAKTALDWKLIDEISSD